ncbi:HIT family protein [Candidatus Woesearchaeota archaeon]|nr:MAG: HIT family protein [Candidatus Woesearchaeota archaeon]
MEVSQEDLKNMSPEQIAELQKKNCIFCHIAHGRVQSKKVFEDDKVLGILDINPANPGHTLLIPKEHYAIMPQMPEDLIAHMFRIAKHISQAMLRGLQAKGTNIFVANGVAAGQQAPHFMIHIIPRKEGDDVSCFKIPKQFIAPEELDKLHKMLLPRVNSVFGIKQGVVEAEFEEKPVKESIDVQSIIKESVEELKKEKQGLTQEEQKEEASEEEIEEIKEEETGEKAEKEYVSSKKSDKYHTVNCPFAQNISDENRLVFSSAEEAEEHFKQPCKCVNKNYEEFADLDEKRKNGKKEDNNNKLIDLDTLSQMFG